MFSHPRAPGATAAPYTTLCRVAGFIVQYDTTLKSITMTEADHVAVLWRVLDRCVLPAEQRAHAQFGGGTPAALMRIEVKFPYYRRANASILGPLATKYPALVRSLKVLTIGFNDYDESSDLAAFATLATHLRELTFWRCGLTSLQGVEGRCEHLRKVDVYGCNLTSIDALADHLYLEEVDVSETDIKTIEPLRTCPSLRNVRLLGCRLLASDEAVAYHQRLLEIND